MRGERSKPRPAAIFGLFAMMLVMPGMTGAVTTVDEPAITAPPKVETIRVAETSARSETTAKYGSANPDGLTFIPGKSLFVMSEPAPGGTRIVGVATSQDPAGDRLLTGVRSPALAPSASGDGLVAFDATGQTELGSRLFTGPVAFSPADLGITDARGAALGPDGWYILDGETRQITAVSSTGTLKAGKRVTLAETITHPVGLAYNDADGLMYVASGTTVYAVEGAGHVMAAYDLADLRVREVFGLAFAPSADTSDDPSIVHLFALADTDAASHELVEVAVRPVAATATTRPDGSPTTTTSSGGAIGTSALRPVSSSQTDEQGPSSAQSSAATTIVAGLVKTLDLSTMVPNSPDTAGIAYIPSTDHLIIADSEVNEITSQYVGVNLWRITKNRSVVQTGSTTDPNPNGYSKEPTGLGYDAASGKLYVSDDDADKITNVRAGSDGIFGTGDDVWSQFSTKTLFPGNSAPDGEGIAFDPDTGNIWTIDGVNSELYQVTTGGSFVSAIDTAQFGAVDPEGLAYNPEAKTLMVLDHKSDIVYEINKSGSLVRTIDVKAANAVTAAGLEYAPSSTNPGVKSLWVTDRGIDNGDGDTTINDGKLFELSIGGTGNFAPAVTISTPTEGAKLPANTPVTLTASATDVEDGNVSPSITWSSTIGGALGSGPSISVSLNPGLHTLTASAIDGIGAVGSSSVKVFVGDGPFSLTAPLTLGPSDVEERLDTNAVSMAGSDLELGVDGNRAQAVGLRFTPSIPQGSFVKSAYVQFTVDENSSSAANLTIKSQDSGNAGAFTGNQFDVSGRPKNPQSVSWTPPQWSGSGTAGPAQRTPDLWPILDPVFAKQNWAPGNGLVLAITGTGTRTAKSFESNAPAVMHIEFQFKAVARPPVITITAPSNNTSHPLRRAISFTGTAVDQITGQNLTSSLAWSSNLDGPIGTGGSVSKVLSKGTHIVSASATGSKGDVGTATVNLVVENHAPTVKIDSPKTGTSFPIGSSITFTSTSSDLEDGNLAYRTTWASNKDGAIGRGGMITARLSAGTHTITATATDTDGPITVSDSIQVTIASQAPSVAIVTPSNESSHQPGLPITFGGTASDPEQGSLTNQIAWSSSKDGAMGTGGTLSKLLSDGSHTITAKVTDNTGKTATASIDILIKNNAATVVDLALASAGDDAEEFALLGTVSTSSGDLDLMIDQGREQIVGLRYAVPVPKGATITEAWVQFTADSTSDAATSLTIQCQKADNAAAFAETLKNLSGRTLTTASVAWEPQAWTMGEAGEAQKTPDLSPIIQEVVNRSGWAPGNHMAFILTGTGGRSAESFESGAGPILHVDWE